MMRLCVNLICPFWRAMLSSNMSEDYQKADAGFVAIMNSLKERGWVQHWEHTYGSIEIKWDPKGAAFARQLKAVFQDVQGPEFDDAIMQFVNAILRMTPEK